MGSQVSFAQLPASEGGNTLFTGSSFNETTNGEMQRTQAGINFEEAMADGFDMLFSDAFQVIALHKKSWHDKDAYCTAEYKAMWMLMADRWVRLLKRQIGVTAPEDVINCFMNEVFASHYNRHGVRYPNLALMHSGKLMAVNPAGIINKMMSRRTDELICIHIAGYVNKKRNSVRYKIPPMMANCLPLKGIVFGRQHAISGIE